MADVRKNVQKISSAGLAATYHSDLTTTDTFLVRNSGKTVLHFKKSGAGACNVTINTPGTVDGLAVAQRVVVVPATTGDVFISGLRPNDYNDVNGDLRITLDEVTGLTLAVMDPG